MPKFSSNLAKKVLRLVLYRNETYHPPRVYRTVQVLSGIAWMTVAREDIILRQGEKASFVSSKDILISALGDTPLILEIHK
ncbi:MAG: hypothetical protein JXA33_24905 [Anaerolineae bacterium]|nr:hypothetical protein [Anaerolineae bacterium]